ncbi:Similar to TSPAN11: Tetraspanin-11 (Bos taurus) [Cotesia congregata]|uniref:Tetraspanin n=1 Tax=Cotesia congregata TaxID=51543 RepID=A0A8J2HNB6_COTCN|nr:Similar to TSPAN11: Tetraspanin-11 (Bos taurus) [Cotesia congregata]
MGYGTEMDGCGRFMKYSLFIANLIIFIGGCTVVGIVIWAFVDKVPYLSALVGNDLLAGVVYVLLVGGILIILSSFFGCVGAAREVKCMLLTYFIIVFLLFVIMLIGGVLGYVFRSKVIGTIEQEMRNTMRLYDKHDIHDAWDTTQRTFHCCGVTNYRDWNTFYQRIPASCCKEIEPGKYFNCNYSTDSINPSNTYQDGCLDKTRMYIQKHASIMGAAGIAIAVLMFFGMIFSCALFRMIG